jgi:hypothetical protein
MIANNLVHQAILAGHSARFLTAADLILDLTKQETARVLQQRLRTYMRPAPLAIDDVGYLSYDAHAADPLFPVVSRRYEQVGGAAGLVERPADDRQESRPSGDPGWLPGGRSERPCVDSIRDIERPRSI